MAKQVWRLIVDGEVVQDVWADTEEDIASVSTVDYDQAIPTGWIKGSPEWRESQRKEYSDSIAGPICCTWEVVDGKVVRRAVALPVEQGEVMTSARRQRKYRYLPQSPQVAGTSSKIMKGQGGIARATLEEAEVLCAIRLQGAEDTAARQALVAECKAKLPVGHPWLTKDPKDPFNPANRDVDWGTRG